MREDKDNPLIPAILQVLRQAEKTLAIHELLQELKAVAKIPSLDDDVQLALFKLNWLMMNALYQLQMQLIEEGYFLSISTLDIHLEPARELASASAQQISCQPLRDYYLNWGHFSDTTKEEVQALLDGVWQEYISGDEQAKAYQVLGLEEGASIRLIRKTYRSLAGRYHPDKGGDPIKFMEIREAYEILKKARS
jgi:DnaJ-domain-containing protein 1